MELIGEITAWLSDPANWEGRFGLPNLVLQHVTFSAVSILLALAIALPLGLWVGHRGKGQLLVVNIGNIGRAIPDFGIIVLAAVILLPIMGLTSLPVYIALAALAVPPILVNTYTGIDDVDRDLVGAARGMGMTGRQILWHVEAPVAIPVIMAGVRTAAVQVVATATLAGVIGQGGLGRPIVDAFSVGFRTGRARVIVASALVAVLAMVTEFALGALQRAITPRGITARALPATPSRSS